MELRCFALFEGERANAAEDLGGNLDRRMAFGLSPSFLGLGFGKSRVSRTESSTFMESRIWDTRGRTPVFVDVFLPKNESTETGL